MADTLLITVNVDQDPSSHEDQDRRLGPCGLTLLRLNVLNTLTLLSTGIVGYCIHDISEGLTIITMIVNGGICLCSFFDLYDRKFLTRWTNSRADGYFTSFHILMLFVGIWYIVDTINHPSVTQQIISVTIFISFLYNITVLATICRLCFMTS